MFTVTLGKSLPNLGRHRHSVVTARFAPGDLGIDIPSGRTSLTGGLPPALYGTDFGRIVVGLLRGNLEAFERNGDTVKFFFKRTGSKASDSELDLTAVVFADRGHQVTPRR